MSTGRPGPFASIKRLGGPPVSGHILAAPDPIQDPDSPREKLYTVIAKTLFTDEETLRVSEYEYRRLKNARIIWEGENA